MVSKNFSKNLTYFYFKGGGLTTYNHGNMKYMKLTYGEGLRVPKM